MPPSRRLDPGIRRDCRSFEPAQFAESAQGLAGRDPWRLERCEDEPLREKLDSLWRLHALAPIERERGWFFEHGRMTGPRANAITRAVSRLCAELRGEEVELVVERVRDPGRGARGADRHARSALSTR